MITIVWPFFKPPVPTLFVFQVLKHPDIAKIAAKHGKSTANVVIRWHLQVMMEVKDKTAPGCSRGSTSMLLFGWQNYTNIGNWYLWAAPGCTPVLAGLFL